MKIKNIFITCFFIISICVSSMLHSCKKEEDMLISEDTLSDYAWITGVSECSGFSGGDSVTAIVSGAVIGRTITASPGGSFRIAVPPNTSITINIFNSSEDTSIIVLSGALASTVNLGFIRLCGSYNGLSIAAGGFHSLVVKPDGTLWAFGSNLAGQLGNNDSDRVVIPVSTTYQNILAPIMIGSSNKWKQVASGLLTSYGLRGDGTSWSWGRDSSGSCGVGIGVGVDTLNWTRPKQNGNAVASIYSGNGFACWRITLNTQELWACGKINCSYLPPPFPLIEGTVFPIQIGVDGGWSKVATYNLGAWAIKTDGTLWRTLPGNQTALIQYGTDTWLDIASGVAIRSDNALFTFDSLGVFNQIYSSSSATDTTWRWKRVSAWEGGHIMAIKTNGELWGWGINTYGEIGDGTIINRSAPVKIGTDRTWMDVSAGGNHTIATKTNGSVWTWGLNSSGQLGTGDNLNHTKPWQIYF